MSKIAEQIHDIVLKKGEEYSKQHGNSVIEEVVYGRGYKTGYIEGYEQAEKDLELIIKDIEAIDQIMLDLSNAYATGNFNYEMGSDGFYKETLKRFNELKENKPLD